MHLMRWRIGLGEDRGLGGSQVESVRAVASSPPTHPCYSLPFRATDPNWVWSSDWQAGQTITWTTDEANLFTPILKVYLKGAVRPITYTCDGTRTTTALTCTLNFCAERPITLVSKRP